jgi:hypothetical protein
LTRVQAGFFEKNFYPAPIHSPPSLVAIRSFKKAPPSFLNRSEDTITFSREDHPNRILNPC